MKSFKKIMMTIFLLLSVIVLHAQTTSQVNSQLKTVFDHYIALKNDLVKTDRKAAMKNAKELSTALSAVKTESLSATVKTVWIKVDKNLLAQANVIAETTDINKQRDAFKTLSTAMFEVMKVSKLDETLYYQYCPMKDAFWISTENKIKNPYYGSQMLTCGKVVETIE